MIPSGTASLDEASMARRQTFVDAARELFFANGYAGTTMSSIASKVGGSKTTLWTYFPSKEELFAAVVVDIVEKYGLPLRVDLPLDLPVRDVLRNFGNICMNTLMADPLMALYRLVVGEAERFPHLAKIFYDTGPRRGKARLAEWMQVKMERGELRADEPMLAVSQFMGLCQSGRYQLMVLGLAEGRADERVADEIDAAIDTFCRAWAADAGAP